MQDFYIQQRTNKALDADQIQRWYLTVEMLAPPGVIKNDDQIKTPTTTQSNSENTQSNDENTRRILRVTLRILRVTLRIL